MNEDRHFERQMDAADAYADRVDRARENEIYRLTSQGGDCFPWTAEHIQEAVAEAEWSKLNQIAQERQSGERIDAGLMLLWIVEDYWTAQAVADATNRINEPEDD